MIKELARHRCTGDDGTEMVVVERRHCVDTPGARRDRGAAFAALLDGEPVRYIDGGTFEIIATGEMLVHDVTQCDCAKRAGNA
jgi:hypothetical protein